MAPRVDHLKDELTEHVVAILQKKLRGPRAAEAEAFTRWYYTNVAPTDMATHSPETLYGSALSLWQFGQCRAPGEAKVRAFNPRLADHGYKSHHTVIEIVNDDMPFLVDSVTAELNRRGLTVHLVIHPTVPLERDEKGKVVRLRELKGKSGAGRESFMHFEVDEQSDPKKLEEIRTGIAGVLADVRTAVEDWAAMRKAVSTVKATLNGNPAGLPAEDVAEAEAFLSWILDDHFTLLGYRRHDYKGSGAQLRTMVGAGGLGVLRAADRQVLENWQDGEAPPPEARAFIEQPRVLMITKGSARSTVHRAVHLDMISVKRFGEKGQVIGEDVIVGLFTSAAYGRDPTDIPALRQKLKKVMGRAGFPEGSHDYKALAHILTGYPRDELLQIDEDTLSDNAIGILQLQERQRIALFLRRDGFGRYLSALVYVPRDRYTSQLRARFGDILERALGGKVVAFTPQLASDSVLAQVLYIVKTTPGKKPAFSIVDIEKAMVEAARSWADRLREALVESTGEETGLRLFHIYGEAFSSGYRESYSPDETIMDIAEAEKCRNGGALGMNLHRALEAEDHELRLKLYNSGSPLPLSDILPMLENMGLRVISEEPYRVSLPGGSEAVWITDFELTSQAGSISDIAAVKEKFHATFGRVFSGDVENDGFNRLVLGAGLEWREVSVLRTFCKFLRQARIPFSQAYMEETLSANPTLARLIVRLFLARFDPAGGGENADKLVGEIEAQLERVVNLDEDRILRHFLNVVQATLRTNYFRTDDGGAYASYLSVKLNSRQVDGLPEPRPMAEIFVYSPRMEGCHLRGGTVARGGIRWSDRREDFRTEVLGLAKAQMVKNAVIVPVGSKGGFVCKRLPVGGDRSQLMDEVVACYSTLMRGMLDITDNLVGGAVVPPDGVVRQDEDDPYLVVAADKGTATFSDIANGISKDYGFWLGDGFASGGSAGYDHKKMGITARGAWESVKRHFRELGRDIQSEEFSVIGIGDMSGDVFGNGMLLSDHIRLVGAFNHLHIFIDPEPDPKTSLAERRRLFELPRSSWSDYDAKLISKGGGIFERSAKTIKLSPQIRAMLGIEEEKLAPNDLLKALLKTPTDLLWFGGIGTYVKAAAESDGDAGDRANDPLRVNARELQCKVIGEGANLGITQLGRIEFSRAGGLINTDFIDNSAGVDTSDHEVNIKIVLDDVVSNGDMTEKQRNELLAIMTDDIAGLVLNDNYLQTQAISLANLHAPSLLDQQWRMIRSLERSGRLNREIEFLPDDEEMGRRQANREGLSRPENAVLFSYAKLDLYEELLPTNVPDDAYLVGDQARYFPKKLQGLYPDQIARHRLRREIIATYVVNSMVNRVGATFVHNMQARTGLPAADIARAFVAARDAFNLRPVWRDIEKLDNKVAADVQAQMVTQLMRLVERVTKWYLDNEPQPLNIADTIARYSAGIEALSGRLGKIVGDDDKVAMNSRVAALVEQGVPKKLAERIGGLEAVGSACDIVRIADAAGVPVVDAGRIYFRIGSWLGADWLREASRQVKVESEWQRLALDAIVDDSFNHQSQITAGVLQGSDGGALPNGTGERLIAQWLDGRRPAVERTGALFAELRAALEVDLAMLTVANRQLRTLVAA